MKKLVIIDTIKQIRKIVPEHSQEIGRGKFLEVDTAEKDAVPPRRPRRNVALRVEDLYNPSDEYDSDDYDDFDPLSSDEYSLKLGEYSDDFGSEDDINNDSGLDC